MSEYTHIPTGYITIPISIKLLNQTLNNRLNHGKYEKIKLVTTEKIYIYIFGVTTKLLYNNFFSEKLLAIETKKTQRYL